MALPTILDLANQVEHITHDLRSRVDDSDKVQKKLYEDLTSKTGMMQAETKATVERMQREIDRLMDEIKHYRVDAARPPRDGSQKPMSEGKKAFFKAIRYAGKLEYLTPEERSLIEVQRMSPEQKALYVSDATTGGFFASTDFINELQQYKLLISPMRQICRQQATSGEKVQMPALANDTSAYWAVEQATFSESSDPTLGMINIPVHEARGLLRISQQNLEDSLFNLEELIKTRLGLKFAQLEGTAFVKGNGVGQPRGFLSYPIKASSAYTGGSAGKNNVTDAIAYVPSGAAANITADSIIQMLMDLKSYYAPTCTWVFTRSTLGTLRLFKDSMNRPLWQPFAAGNLPATIYDRPYVEMPDMDEISANTYPILLGDFQYYLIADRLTLNLTQLNELYITQGLIGFIARFRVGGDILLPEAFRVMKVSTS